MSQTLDEEIIKFLKAKENFPHALDICRYLPEARNQLLNELWNALKNQVQNACPPSLAKENWQFTLTDVNRMDQEKWGGLLVCAEQAASQKQSLKFKIEQENTEDHYDFYWGIGWPSEVAEEDRIHQVKEVVRVKAYLKQKGFKDDSPTCWLGWRMKRIEPKNEMLKCYVEDPDQLLERLTGDFWSLVSECCEMVRRANDAIRRLAE